MEGPGPGLGLGGKYADELPAPLPRSGLAGRGMAETPPHALHVPPLGHDAEREPQAAGQGPPSLAPPPPRPAPALVTRVLVLSEEGPPGSGPFLGSIAFRRTGLGRGQPPQGVALERGSLEPQWTLVP